LQYTGAFLSDNIPTIEIQSTERSYHFNTPDRYLWYCSGKPWKLAREDIIPPIDPAWPRASEQAADLVAALGVNAAVVRLSPSVPGEGDQHGFMPMMLNTVRAVF